MNVSTLVISADEARTKLDQHKRIQGRQRTLEDDKLQILFEMKEWQVYPVDPFLMRRISGMLFIIEAEWELSPLEAELLDSVIQGN